jgi:hypothetical protein
MNIIVISQFLLSEEEKLDSLAVVSAIRELYSSKNFDYLLLMDSGDRKFDKIFSFANIIMRKLPKDGTMESCVDATLSALKDLTKDEMSKFLFTLFYSNDAAAEQFAEKSHPSLGIIFTPAEDQTDHSIMRLQFDSEPVQLWQSSDS